MGLREGGKGKRMDRPSTVSYNITCYEGGGYKDRY
jgi:hypothetical protein